MLIYIDILIVEEDIVSTSDLKAVLKKLGHTVVAVLSNGEDAMEVACNLNPDLIFINIKLKGNMNGVETGKRIKECYNIPVIFLTVFTKNCLNKSLQLSEDEIILSQPIKEEHVKYCIERAVLNK